MVMKWKECGWFVFVGDEVNVEEFNKFLKWYCCDGVLIVI